MKPALPSISLGKNGSSRIRRAVHWPVLLGGMLLIALWLALAGYVQAQVEASMATLSHGKEASAWTVPEGGPIRAAQQANGLPVAAMVLAGQIASLPGSSVGDDSPLEKGVEAVGEDLALSALQAEVDQALEASPVEFAYMKNHLRADSRRTLLHLGARLAAEKPAFEVQVRVHASSWGSSERNLEVSAARADVVRNQLLAAGLPENRVTAEGVGEAEPLHGRNERETRRLNRRTEIRIVRG